MKFCNIASFVVNISMKSIKVLYRYSPAHVGHLPGQKSGPERVSRSPKHLRPGNFGKKCISMQVNIFDSFYQNFRVVGALGADKPSLAHFSGQVNSEHWAGQSWYGTFILFIPICTAKENAKFHGDTYTRDGISTLGLLLPRLRGPHINQTTIKFDI